MLRARATNHFPLLQPAVAWLPILGFIALSVACLVANLGTVLNLVFPAGAFLIAIFLYWRYPLMYVSFVWWIWFLSAWVRRLADYYGADWTNPSPVLLAPLLVTLVSGLSFLKCLTKPSAGLPFLLCAAGVAYSAFVGLVLNSPQAAIVDLLGWMPPIFFGFFLFSQWRDYPLYRKTTQRTFFWGLVVMGGYGIVQYLVAPAWDQHWMTNTLIYENFMTVGDPEPLKIRVFSTLNAPQSFGSIMMAGLLLVLTMSGSRQLFGGSLGAIATLLSLARSAWLSLIAALLVFVPSIKQSFQIRLMASLLVLLLALVPVVQMEPFASAILPRIQGLTNTSDDISARERTEGYQRLLGQAFSSVAGRGMGFVVEDDSIGSRDSGVLSLWFNLGWLGALPYLVGVGLLFYSLFTTVASRFDLFASAARAIAAGTFAQVGFNVITTGQFGAVLWAFLGLGLAARQYYTATRQQNSLQDLNPQVLNSQVLNSDFQAFNS